MARKGHTTGHREGQALVGFKNAAKLVAGVLVCLRTSCASSGHFLDINCRTSMNQFAS